MNYDTPTAYAALGWYIVPLHWPQSDGSCSCNDDACDHVGKHPRVANWQSTATLDDGLIRNWWGLWPNANIGIVTGEKSNLLVLDIDPDSDWRQIGPLPRTLSALTGNGQHYYFTHPGIVLPNAVRFLPGCDIRTDGGLVVAPPSLHANGQRYEWVGKPDSTPLAECPEWLIEAVLASAKKQAETTKSSGFAVPALRPAQGGQPYAVKALHEELAKVRAALDGQRNNQLNKSAFAIGTLLDAGQLDADAVFGQLVDAAISAGLPAHEARTTARSGLQAGQNKPRQIEPPRRPGGDDGAPPSLPSDSAPAAASSQSNSDLGNAARFAAQHGHKLRYVSKWSTWLIWDTTRWQRDETCTVYRLARETIKHMYIAAGQTDDEKERKKQAQWALASESKARIEAMLSLAQSEAGIAIAPDQLDAEQYVINCTNGTLDLRTGELRAHCTDDLITKRIPVHYDMRAACPIWLAFLHRVFAGDDELITYVQRCVGYTLTGSTQEQCLFFAYGTGRNGKSTFFETLLALLGEYGQKAPTELIMTRAPNTATNDVARLAGARLVVTAEVEEGRRLSESLVKDLTGGDTLVARFLYQELFEFTPTHKLWVYGNHKPEVKGTDPGIWRRIRVIPFAVQIPAAEVDPLLKRKLLGELPGILSWAVRGCLDHQAHGLPEPRAVQHATQAYRAEMDTLAAFIQECCTEHPNAQAKVSDLYKVYQQWCDDNGERALTRRRLGRQLTERGFDLVQFGHNKEWYRLGLGLLTADHEPADVADVKPPVFMNLPHESNSHESHENTPNNIRNIRTEDQKVKEGLNSAGLPPLARAIGSDEGATVQTGLTALRLSPAQWQEARDLYDRGRFGELNKLSRNWRVGYMKLLDALKSEGEP